MGTAGGPDAVSPRPAELASRAAQLEPFAWYRRMRAESPVHYDERRDVWDVFPYETISEILLDEETFSSDRNPDEVDRYPSMLSADPPQHTKLRSPVEEFFTPSAVASLASEVRSTTEALLDDAVDGGRMDIVSALAYPLPIATIAALLGVPREDRDRFKEWSDTVIAGPQLTGGDQDRLDDRQREAGQALVDYFGTVVERRRRAPQDDLISEVLVDDEHGRALSDEELLGLFRLLLVAGNVTTTNLITNAVWCFTNWGCIDELRGDEDRLRAAIEEVLRYRSPVQRTSRIALEDTEIAGRHVEEGDQVVTWLGSANRDPDRFDEPDRFIPDRSPNPHLAFGRGIHFCLGAPLARMEARIALSMLLDRIENLKLVDIDHQPVASTFIYGVRRLPITFDVRP